MRRFTSALAAATLLATSAVLGGTASPAAAAGCTTTSGVVVIVDSGSGIKQNCVPGDPATGGAALTANNSIKQNASGLICQINGTPNVCPKSPGPYWSYWHASAASGWTWKYSSLGAYGYNPKPGTVEGWAYGGGNPPRMAPPVPPAPAPAPAPVTTKPPVKPVPAPEKPAPGGGNTLPVQPTEDPPVGAEPSAPTSPGTTSSASTSNSPGQSSAASSSAAASSTAASSAAVSGSESPTDSVAPSQPGSINADPASDSSTTAWIWPVVAVVALAGGGAALWLTQRPKAEPSG